MLSREQTAHRTRHTVNRRRAMIRLWAVPAVVVLAKGCGDGDSPIAPPAPEPARPTSVTVSPASAELAALGATVQLAAQVRDQDSRVMAGATVNWNTGNASVATVAPTGLVAAVGNGQATITATAGSASGSAVVTVMQSVASVEVLPADWMLAVGSTLQLAAEAFDANGHAVTGVMFAWESADTSVATVDPTGLVTALGNGHTTITATAGSASGTARVTVAQIVNDADRAALVALYEATDGPNWTNHENWLTDAPLDQWFGVSVDLHTGRVTQLDLRRNNLARPDSAGDMEAHWPHLPELGLQLSAYRHDSTGGGESHQSHLPRRDQWSARRPDST